MKTVSRQAKEVSRIASAPHSPSTPKSPVTYNILYLHPYYPSTPKCHICIKQNFPFTPKLYLYTHISNLHPKLLSGIEKMRYILSLIKPQEILNRAFIPIPNGPELANLHQFASGLEAKGWRLERVNNSYQKISSCNFPKVAFWVN